MEARIVREDGTEADFNQLGELWLRSGNISPGYWKNEKANKETFQDGWLRTGDYFRVDENGYFWYGDRVKVMEFPFFSCWLASFSLDLCRTRLKSRVLRFLLRKLRIACLTNQTSLLSTLLLLVFQVD